MILLTPLIMNGRPMNKRPMKGRYRVALITFAPACQCTWAEGPEGLGPLARANRGQASAIDHLHGDFHSEAKLGGLRSLPSHFNVLSWRRLLSTARAKCAPRASNYAD